MRKILAVFAALAVFALASGYALAETKAPAQPPAEKKYAETAQSDLSSNRESFNGKPVSIQGQFLFTGSDFCYQIRQTKINTRDYFCFALGPINLIRFYLKKDHAQVDELLKVKKGSTLKVYGDFDSTGNDYKYMVVDKFEVVKN